MTPLKTSEKHVNVLCSSKEPYEITLLDLKNIKTVRPIHAVLTFLFFLVTLL